MATTIVILILAVIIFFAARSSVKHLKGEGGCCGGGSSDVIREPDKQLEGPVLYTKKVRIEGMHCENCVNRVKRALNRIDGIAATVDLKDNTAVVSYEKEVSDDIIRMAVERLEYRVLSIEE